MAIAWREHGARVRGGVGILNHRFRCCFLWRTGTRIVIHNERKVKQNGAKGKQNRKTNSYLFLIHEVQKKKRKKTCSFLCSPTLLFVQPFLAPRFL